MFNTSNLMLFLTVIGTLSAILFPVVGWIFRRKELPQLDVVLDKEVFLVNQLAGNLSNFSIVIDEKPASDQVVWITGWIVNSGSNDVSERIIEHPLKLQLPENMQWVRGDVKHSSVNVKCDSEIISPQELQFKWVLLKSGEYIYFDALLECPIEETKEDWEGHTFIEIIKPYSRIENIRTTSLLDIAQLGEIYNPLKPHDSNLVAKSATTFPAILLLAYIWMSIFFPFKLDNLYGDGFLVATPSIVKMVDGVPVEPEVSVDRRNNIRLTFSQPDNDSSKYEEYMFSTPDELFSNEDLKVGKITARDRSKETSLVVLSGFMTIILTWVLLYMWFPKMFIFNYKKRRTATALLALKSNLHQE